MVGMVIDNRTNVGFVVEIDDIKLFKVDIYYDFYDIHLNIYWYHWKRNI